jgi:hypothetical protein
MLSEEMCIGYKDNVKIMNHICKASSTDNCNYLSNVLEDSVLEISACVFCIIVEYG